MKNNRKRIFTIAITIVLSVYCLNLMAGGFRTRISDDETGQNQNTRNTNPPSAIQHLLQHPIGGIVAPIRDLTSDNNQQRLDIGDVNSYDAPSNTEVLEETPDDNKSSE